MPRAGHLNGSQAGCQKGCFWTLMKMEFLAFMILSSVEGGEGRNTRGPHSDSRVVHHRDNGSHACMRASRTAHLICPARQRFQIQPASSLRSQRFESLPCQRRFVPCSAGTEWGYGLVAYGMAIFQSPKIFFRGRIFQENP